MVELAAGPGVDLLTYSAESGSKSVEALRLPESWTVVLEVEVTLAAERAKP